MNNNTTDTFDSVGAFAPTSADLEMLWPDSDREDMLVRLRDECRAGRSGGRYRFRRPNARWVAVLAASGAAAAAVVVTATSPSATPSKSATNAEQRPAAVPSTATRPTSLSQLAILADASSVGTLAPGQVMYQGWQETTTGSIGEVDQAGDGTQPPQVITPGHHGSASTTRETWTASDGTQWARVTSPGLVEIWKFESDGCSLDGDSSGAFLVSLPTDPAKLDALLRAEATKWADGKQLTSQPNATALMHGRYFALVENLLANPLAPAPLRSALFRTLQLLPEVSVTAGRTSTGQPADVLAGSFAYGDRKQMLVDPGTTALRETVDTLPAGADTGLTEPSTDVVTYGHAEVASAVPADVLHNAVRAGGPAPTACSVRPTN